jgi:hypothetical protein
MTVARCAGTRPTTRVPRRQSAASCGTTSSRSESQTVGETAPPRSGSMKTATWTGWLVSARPMPVRGGVVLDPGWPGDDLSAGRGRRQTGPPRRAALRTAPRQRSRQKAILGERKPDIRLVIGEAALHQAIGGPEVMESQLAILAGVSGDSGVITVQIMPFSSWAHAASRVGSLAILQFPEAPGLGVVHLGGADGGVCLESEEDLAVHARAFEQLRAFALSPAHSARLLRGQAAI